MKTQIAIEQLAEKLNATVWSKGDLKRIYLNDEGWNTRKMSTKTFVWQNESGDFVVSCRIECPSQAWQWIKSQEEEVKRDVYSKIEAAIAAIEEATPETLTVTEAPKIEGAGKWAIVSPCYHANGYHGRYVSYAETDESGEITFGVGDHFFGKLSVGSLEGGTSNIKELPGRSYSDSDRIIRVAKINDDADTQFAREYYNERQRYAEADTEWRNSGYLQEKMPIWHHYYDYNGFCTKILELKTK